MRVEGDQHAVFIEDLHRHAGGAAVGNFHQLRVVVIRRAAEADFDPGKGWPARFKPDCEGRFDIADRACTGELFNPDGTQRNVLLFRVRRDNAGVADQIPGDGNQHVIAVNREREDQQSDAERPKRY